MKWALRSRQCGEVIRVVGAMLVIAIMFAVGIVLLTEEYLTGGAFVSFVGVICAVGFVIAQWPRFLGSSLKLRELNTEAEQMIESLRRGRLNLCRTAMNLTLRQPGGWVDRYCDGRVPDFLEVVDMIRDEKLLPYLADEVRKGSARLISSQFDGLSKFSHEATDFDLRGITPSDLPTVFRAWAMREGSEYVATDPIDRVAKEVERLDCLLKVSREAQEMMPWQKTAGS